MSHALTGEFPVVDRLLLLATGGPARPGSLMMDTRDAPRALVWRMDDDLGEFGASAANTLCNFRFDKLSTRS